MLISIHAKTELLPLTHQLPCCCVIFEINYLLPELSVHVSNYTKVICLCVKLYQRYLFLCQIIQKLSVHVSNLK